MRRIGVCALAVVLAITGTVSAGATEPTERRGDALTVQSIHDTLRDAAAAGDVVTARSTVAELAPLLADMASGKRYALPATSRDLVTSASDATAVAQSELARPIPARDIPSALSQLLQVLLLSLIQLVENLLGPGMPAPVPVPTPAPAP